MNTIASFSFDYYNWLVAHWDELQAILDPLTWFAIWVWIVTVMAMIFKFLK